MADGITGALARRYQQLADAALAQQADPRFVGGLGGQDLRYPLTAGLAAGSAATAAHRGLGAFQEALSFLPYTRAEVGEPRIPELWPEWEQQPGESLGGAALDYGLGAIGALTGATDSRVREMPGGAEILDLESSMYDTADRANVPGWGQFLAAMGQPGISDIPSAAAALKAMGVLAVVPRSKRKFFDEAGDPRGALIDKETGEDLTDAVFEPGVVIDTNTRMSGEPSQTLTQMDIEAAGTAPNAKSSGPQLLVNTLASNKYQLVLKDGSRRPAKEGHRIKAIHGASIKKGGVEPTNHAYADEIVFDVPSSAHRSSSGEPSVYHRAKGDIYGVGDSRNVHVSGRTRTLYDRIVVVPKGAEAPEGGILLTSDTPAKKRAPRGMKAVQNLRAMRNHSAAYDVAKDEPHLILNPQRTGYVGGPPGVRTAADIQAMRDHYDELVEMGYSRGADWYKRMQEQAREVAPGRENQFAEEGALWSAQATPPTELLQNLQAHNAYELGYPMHGGRVRTGKQTDKFLHGRATGDYQPSLKTGPYGQARTSGLPPTIGGTHDIWDSRSWGWPKKPKKLGETQHMFMDYETVLAVERANRKKLGGRSDWTADEIQASAWVAQGGLDRLKQFDGDIDAALDSMNDTSFADKFAYSLTHETRPYRGQRHLEGMTEIEAEAYGADPRSSWLDPETGHDHLVAATGMYQLPAMPHRGIWVPESGVSEFNPGTTSRPLVSYYKDPILDEAGNPVVSKDGVPQKRSSVVTPEDEAVLGGLEHFRAAMDVQGMGAGHSTTPRGERMVLGGEAPAVTIQHGALSTTNVDRLAQLANDPNMDIEDVVTRADQTSFLNWGDEAQMGPKPGRTGTPEAEKADAKVRRDALKRVKARAKAIDEALRDLRDNGVVSQAELARWHGFVASYEDLWAHEGLGRVTQRMLDAIPERLRQQIDDSPALRRVVANKLELDEEVAKTTGRPIREDVQNLRRIFAKGGLAAVKKALEEGALLPALVVPLLGAAMAAVNEEQPFGRARGALRGQRQGPRA